MSRPNLIARSVTLLAAVAAVVVVILVVSGGKTYDLKLALANASGLRPGSEVLLGGVQVGTVNSLDMSNGGRGDTVIADLNLKPNEVKIGRGASASIIAANLLGEKYVALSPGNVSQPLPPGTTLPESATTLPSDLDQIINVLDGPTRARLAILLNEAGMAVAGRQSDVSAIIRQFPLSLTAATKLLTTMVQDNHTLASLVQNSDQFITRIDAQSTQLKSLIDTSAGAAKTFADRASALQGIIAGGPKLTNYVTREFIIGTTALNDLANIEPAVVNILPRVDSLLHAVKPFTQKAVPTLNKAAAVAPQLTQLAEQATPTIHQAVPTLASLQNVAHLAGPLSSWLGLSTNDLVNILGDWAGAVQNRDAASHIFSGNFFFNPAIILTTANLGATAAQRRQNLLDIKSLSLLQTLGLVGAQRAARAALNQPAKAPAATPKPKVNPPKVTPPKVNLPTLGAKGTTPTGTPKPTLGGTLSGILHGLLGSHASGGGSGSAAGGTPSTGTTSGSGASVGSALKGLVGYLLGK